MKQHSLSIKKSLFWILFSTLVVSGSAFATFYYWKYLEKKRLSDPKYEIQKISVNQSLIPISFLREKLQIEGKNLFEVNLVDIENRLKEAPMIESAVVTTLLPDTLSIYYVLRHPIAIVSEKVNTGIDRHGVCFPLTFHHTKENLPIASFGETIDKKRVEYLLAINGSGCLIKEVNFTRLSEKSLGACFIEAVIDRGGRSDHLYFYPEQIEEVFKRYQLLSCQLKDEDRVIDFRVGGMGIISRMGVSSF